MMRFCYFCGRELRIHKHTSIRYCMDCKKGYAIGTGTLSRGQIQLFDVTELEVIAAKFERIEGDVGY